MPGWRRAPSQNKEKLQGILRFRIYEGLPEDEYQVELNGQIIPDANLRIVHQPQGEVSDPPEEPVLVERWRRE